MRLVLGDCLERMGEIDDQSIDLIACDLPYGITACKWDTVIPLEPLWAHYRRVLKPRGAVVLTASQPFTSVLVMSNREWFKYSLVWDKVNKYTDYLNAKKRPMRRHEDILVFYPNQTTYNPSMVTVPPYKSRKFRPSKTDTHGRTLGVDYGRLVTQHNPCSVICIESSFTNGIFHPTQKPVALFEYLIRTYSNEGETVLDNCMGSGTTGVACINTGRSFIGIERDPTYFSVAEKRINEALREMPLLEPATA